jgi:hypothetical protein
LPAVEFEQISRRFAIDSGELRLTDWIMTGLIGCSSDRCFFNHDLLADYFLAESLLTESRTTTDLSREMDCPEHTSSVPFIIEGLAEDPTRLEPYRLLRRRVYVSPTTIGELC